MKKIIPIILSLTAVMSTSTVLAEENITVKNFIAVLIIPTLTEGRL